MSVEIGRPRINFMKPAFLDTNKTPLMAATGQQIVLSVA
jgi:hypothetical protein